MMTVWVALLLASVIVWATKNVGFIVPGKLLKGDLMSGLADAVTVCLLASLVVLQSVGDGTGIQVDARLPALVVAGVLLYFRLPFLVVLISAGGIAALLRAFELLP